MLAYAWMGLRRGILGRGERICDNVVVTNQLVDTDSVYGTGPAQEKNREVYITYKNLNKKEGFRPLSYCH